MSKRSRVHVKTFIDREGWLVVHASGKTFKGAMGALAREATFRRNDIARFREKLRKNHEFGVFGFYVHSSPVMGTGAIAVYEFSSPYPSAMLKDSP